MTLSTKTEIAVGTNDEVSMEEWFKSCTPEQADAMSACQLEYRFEHDNLGSLWWLHLQQLGFQHVRRKYLLPKSAPVSMQREYEGKEIFEYLDRLHIPYMSSSLQGIYPKQRQQEQKNDAEENLKSTCKENEENDVQINEETEWWRNTRDELIFRKFRLKIENMFEISQKTQKGKPRRAAKARNQPKRRGRRPSSSMDNSGEELFMNKGQKRARHSKNDANESKSGIVETIVFPTVEEYVQMANTDLNLDEIAKGEKSYEENFDEWQFKCSLNQSLLLYGVGSKRVLLNNFATELEKDGDVVIIEGFDKDVTIESILDIFVNHWLHGQDPSIHQYDVFLGNDTSNQQYGLQLFPSNLTVQRAMAIAQALSWQIETTLRPIYLVLHNIDGVALRNPVAQEALSVLVHCSMTPHRKLRALRLVTSVDHVNGPAVLWDSLTCQRFQWEWVHVSTHRPYVEEVSQSTEFLQRKTKRKQSVQTASVEEKAIFDVLTSLAPRHTESLQVLAQLQLHAQEQKHTISLEDPSSSSSSSPICWINHADLLRKCQLECIITGDHQLRLFLKEFVDHEIVERKDSTGQALRIPYSTETLIQIINFEHEEL